MKFKRRNCIFTGMRFSIFILFLSSLQIFSQENNEVNIEPTLDEILGFIDKNISEKPVSGVYDLARKPNGYYLCAQFFDDEGQLADLEYSLIYNFSTGKLQVPVFEKSEQFEEDDDQGSLSRFGSIWSRREANKALIYYGYPEATKDVREFVEKKKSPSDYELEALARAYSFEANQYIHPGMYGNYGMVEQPYLDAGLKKLNEERVNGFMDKFQRSLDVWERIRNEYPSHIPSLIVDLDLKIGHEYMHAYFTLKCIHEPELAKSMLEKVRYSESIIKYAKLMLDMCEKGGFLLTHGDSDTYPIWYVQDKLGYRKDVVVINTSLAQLAWYQEFVLNQYQVRSSFTSDQLNAIQHKYIVFNGTKERPFDEWLSIFGNTQNFSNLERVIYIEESWNLPREGDTLYIHNINYVTGAQLFYYDLFSLYPEGKIYSSNAIGFTDLGLYKTIIQKGLIVELLGSDDPRDPDLVEQQYLLDFVKNIPEGYFSGMGDYETHMRDMVLRNMFYLTDTNIKENQDLICNAILGDIDLRRVKPELANMITYYFDRIDLNKTKQFLRDYEEHAKNIINKYQDLKIYDYDDLEDLTEIVSIYTGAPKHLISKYEDEKYKWQGSKELYNLVNKKITENMFLVKGAQMEHTNLRLQGLAHVMANTK